MPTAYEADRRLVNIVQACSIAGIRRSTLYLWMRQGKLDFVRTVGGSPRIYADSLFKRDPRGRKPHDRHL